MRESIYKRYIPGIIPPEETGEDAWWFVFSSDRLLVELNADKANLPYVNDINKLNIKPVSIQYLGRLDGRRCYSAETEAGEEAPCGMVFRDLRSLFGLIDEDIFLLAGRACQIVAWDRTHRYCGKCGTPTETMYGERAKKCSECGHTSYPRLSPAIIVAIVKGDQILLAHAKHFRENMYSVIAGFVEPGETFEDCVRREVMEEVGIKVKNLKYFGSQPWPFPNSLMVAFTAEYDEGEIKVDDVEIGDAGWFDKNGLPETPSGYSVAGQLISWFVNNH